MSNTEKEPNLPNIFGLLGWFFVAITIGGVFLSVGAVGVYHWVNGLPSKIPPAIAIIGLILGIAIDGWAIVRFWQRRNKIFESL